MSRHSNHAGWYPERTCDRSGRLRHRREYTTDGTSWVLATETHYLYDGMRVIYPVR